MSNDTTTAGFSVNERAERLLGRRDAHGPIGIFLDWPVELGYQCPILGHHQSMVQAESGTPTLHWSEYNAFLWCEKCNRDYPSALCTGLSTDDPAQLERSISIYLSNIEQRRQAAVLGYIAELEHTYTQAGYSPVLIPAVDEPSSHTTPEQDTTP